MSRWLVTGSYGQLGCDLQRVLAGAPDVEVRAVDVDSLDITDSAAVQSAVADFRPDVVVNAAGYTAVDAAESDEDRAYQINATGPALLAAALARFGGRLVHVSTDYVFDGEFDDGAARPYEPDDEPNPRSAYGRTKLAGERAVRELLPNGAYVVRTAWLYGQHGHNFVKTMVRLERERSTVSVVDDQRGSPTWSLHLARGLVELVRARVQPGIYHCTSGGSATWFELARAVFTELGADPARVLATSSASYGAPARRPAYSVLSDASWRVAGLRPLPAWRDALHSAFDSGAFAGDSVRAG